VEALHGASPFPPFNKAFFTTPFSTELHIGSMNSGMKDMLNLMSKFLALVLLCYKRKTEQKGQYRSWLSRKRASLMRNVAMERGLCRSARKR
jgi:hypothetical protein